MSTFYSGTTVVRNAWNMKLSDQGRPKRTWRQVVREDCQARKLNKEDAMDRCKMEEVDKGCLMIRIGVSG